MTTPYEDMIIKMLEDKRQTLKLLQTKGKIKEIRLLEKDVADLEAHLKSYQKGVGYFRKKPQTGLAEHQ